ncbi:MAG: system Cascade subunit CasA [Candidatus Methanomethylophilaceae archaeon]|nr:system Cascade subunit CasA [Candidatus Methanomethylophilaceae archaeon]
MNEIEFNLLDKPWILVLREDGTAEEVSITEAFRHAHKIRSLAGELSAQDLAVMRMLLAILYAVYLRMDQDGNESEIEDEDEAVERWKALWDKKKFDIDQIERYLDQYKERFWLFHPKVPFYQAVIDKGTRYSASKLIGELSESENKLRLFGNRSGDGKTSIDYAEAARWLIYLNAFDDTSSKPTVRGEGLPSSGAGWMGKLGLIYSEGNNLFETLMLNLVMTDYNGEPFVDGKAFWESEPSIEERVNIPIPGSPIEMLTLQSRRILLERDGEEVTGYRLMGGDIVQKENALVEQMTVWRKNDEDMWTPKRHDPSRLMWRDFSAIVSKSEGSLKPGVVRWASTLVRRGFFPYDHVTFRIGGVKYANKDFFAEDFIDDAMSFNSELLGNLGESWTLRIVDAIGRTEKCVFFFGNYAKGLSIESGNDPEGNSVKQASEYAKSLAYYSLDGPFRKWLFSIDPGKDDEEERLNEWMENVYSTIVNELGERLFREAGVKALIGRSMDNNSISKFRLLRNSVRKAIRGE